MDIEVLKKLANVGEPQDDLSSLLGGGPTEITTEMHSELRQQLQSLQEQDRNNTMRDSALYVAELIKNSKKARKAGVDEVRALRSQVSTKISMLEAIQMAEEYGLETMNFIPLAILIGKAKYSDVMDNGGLTTVPAEWAEAWRVKRRQANIKAGEAKAAAKKTVRSTRRA